MTDEPKQKLIDLGPEILAEALLNIAAHSGEADDLIDQLIATPKENVQRFTKELSGLKRSGVLSTGLIRFFSREQKGQFPVNSFYSSLG